MSYRDDLDALSHQVNALQKEAGRAQRRLDEAQRLLSEAEARRRLPVLDNISIAAPCKADWSQMQGDERVRFCGQCEKNVYNLSGMLRAEAEALLIEKEGRVCVRYYQRTDGTILTADCPDGLRRRRRRRRVVAATFGAMSAVAGAAAALSGRPPHVVMMGAPPVVATTPAPIEPQPEIRMGEPAPVIMGAVAKQPVEPLMGKIAYTPPVMGKPKMHKTR